MGKSVFTAASVVSYDWSKCDILEIRDDTVMVWLRDTKQIQFVWPVPGFILANLHPLSPLELRRILK